MPSSFCLVAQPIFWSSKDTPETIAQVKQWNAVIVSVCGYSLSVKP